MSGRAGRRGLDDKGIVILMLDAKIDGQIAREMIKGAPDVMVRAHLRVLARSRYRFCIYCVHNM